MSYCGQTTAVNHQPTHTVAFSRRCKRWSCPDCYQENCRTLKRQAHAGEPDLFATLTVNPSVGASSTERAHKMRDAWRLIRRRAIREAMRDPKRRPRRKALARDWPDAGTERTVWPNRVRLVNGKLPFTVVIEQHESGEPHMHILARAQWLDQRWLSAQLRELTGAFIVDVRRIRNKQRASGYVAKYIGKGPAKFDGMKRHWRSQDYIVPPAEPEEAQEAPKPVWWRVEAPLEIVAQDARRDGWAVHWRGNSLMMIPP